MKTLALIVTCLMSVGSIAGAGNTCADIVMHDSLDVDSTESLIAYLSALLINQVVGDRELLQMANSLEAGVITNPISEIRALVSSTALIHREEIQRYLDGGDLDAKRLQKWLKAILKTQKRVKIRRDRTRVMTEEIHQKIEFYPIPAGKFRMIDVNEEKNIDVELTHPFEVMSTKVTQKVWVEVFNYNPSEFKRGDYTVTIVRGRKSIDMQPDHPVGNITWWSAIEFANKLTKKSGLKPAYDTSEIEWMPGTSAARGTLRPITRSSGEKLIINAHNGSIYETEGYRLSTEAEKEYLLRNLGESSGEFPHDIKSQEVGNYAWYKDNSDDQTHPVGTTPDSFKVNGHTFYDLIGNVDEWMHNFTGEQIGGVNPQGPSQHIYRASRGGSFLAEGRRLRSGHREFDEPDTTSRNTGFRLVRTMK